MCCLHQEQKERIVSCLASPASRDVHGIWEADELFRCPLVGIGLTFAEQKQLLKRRRCPRWN